MANTFLAANVYSNTMLLLLKNALVMGKLVSGTFRDEVTDQNGLTVNVKRPPQFIAKDGSTLAEQNIAVGSTAISVDRYRNVHVGVSDLEAVTSFDALMRNATVRSAASTLAHDVDLYLHSKLLSFPNHVGTVTENIDAPAELFAAHTRLMEQSVEGELTGVMSYADAAALRATLVNTNVQGVNRTALERARVPLVSEMDLYATQHIKSLTNGTRVATAGLVNGASQNVNYASVKTIDYSTLSVDGFAAGATIKAGEIFTIAGVYSVNNRSQETHTYLRQFVVTEDATATGGGAIAALKIFPHIIVAGTGGAEADTNTAFATVSAAPADNAAITFLGAASSVYPIRAIWARPAIQLVSARLETPMSDTSSFATDPETGISIRYWRGSDIATGRHIHRWDMVYGAKTIDPRLGTRFSGTA